MGLMATVEQNSEPELEQQSPFQVIIVVRRSGLFEATPQRDALLSRYR